MAVIGFIALFLLGLYLIVAGLLSMYASFGFSGKVPWQLWIVVAMGGGIEYIAFANSPFVLRVVS